MDFSLFCLRIRKLLAVLSTPTYWNSFKRGVVPSIEHKTAFRDPAYDFDFILDVGANKGQFAVFARSRFPRARILCFEPLSKPSKILASVFAGDTQVRTIQAAIAPKSERRQINVTEHDDSSSLLEVGELQMKAFGTRQIGTEEIQCDPLSTFIGESDLGKSNLLKIDVQGYELEVLKACEPYLDRFDTVYCETSYVPLYKSQACAGEVITELQRHGLRLAGVYNQTGLSDGRALQADMIFVRETHNS